MAISHSHILGEFIGVFFEESMKLPIRAFADENGLYFDTMGPRKARNGKKLTWTDIYKNEHDLDFVLEKGGTDEKIGEPVAFIELAWRRYTKHSKNKVQEISGAIDPICEKYRLIKPFKGAILAGEFTDNSLKQLKSDDFHVLYIPFEKIVTAFRIHGLDINFDEDTDEVDFEKKYLAITEREEKVLQKIREEILKSCKDEIDNFILELTESYNRKINNIIILPLHGTQVEVVDIDSAIKYINEYKTIPKNQKLEYIEIIVTYNNGSMIKCQFKTKMETIDFLKKIY